MYIIFILSYSDPFLPGEDLSTSKYIESADGRCTYGVYQYHLVIYLEPWKPICKRPVRTGPLIVGKGTYVIGTGIIDDVID